MEELDRISESEFGMSFDQLGSGEKEWVRDEIENREYLQNKKDEESPVYKSINLKDSKVRRTIRRNY